MVCMSGKAEQHLEECAFLFSPIVSHVSGSFILNYPFSRLFQFYCCHFGSFQYLIARGYTNHILIKLLTSGEKKEKERKKIVQANIKDHIPVKCILEKVPYKHLIHLFIDRLDSRVFVTTYNNIPYHSIAITFLKSINQLNPKFSILTMTMKSLLGTITKKPAWKKEWYLIIKFSQYE